MSPVWVVLSLLSCPRSGLAASELPQLPYGYAPGYTDNVDDEQAEPSQEMVLIEKPDVLKKPPLNERIFNSELTNEFITRYEDTFGRTEAEQNYYLTDKEGYSMSPSGMSTLQEDQQRQQFAQYVVGRLAEYHADNIMKSDPALQKVYSVKQAMSNYKLDVGPKTNVDMRYNIVGNYFEGKVTHPIADLRFVVNMDPSQVVPGAPQEILVAAHRKISYAYEGEMGYTVVDRGLYWLVSHPFNPTTSANITETIHVGNGFIDESRDAVTLVGLSMKF